MSPFEEYDSYEEFLDHASVSDWNQLPPFFNPDILPDSGFYTAKFLASLIGKDSSKIRRAILSGKLIPHTGGNGDMYKIQGIAFKRYQWNTMKRKK